MKNFSQLYTILLSIILIFSSNSLLFSFGNIIIIMGPSCSGKSTLTKGILKKLNSSWKFVGLDEILIERKKQSELGNLEYNEKQELEYLIVEINTQ